MIRNAILAGLLITCSTAHGYADMPSTSAKSVADASVQNSSMDDYRRHLVALQSLVAECAKGRDKAHCDPSQVGLDDRVQIGAGANPVTNQGSNPAAQRRIRYDWLRALLVRAQEPDKAKHKDSVDTTEVSEKDASLPTPKTTSQLLDAATKRLANDLVQAGGQLHAVPQHPSENSAMQKVLAEREFRKLTQRSATDSIAEKVNGWLNSLFNGLSALTEGAAWLGELLVWGFVLAVAAGLVWGLLQLERRWRVKLVPDDNGPAPGAASARDWQLWIEDARKAAEAGQWREAIHFLYWAAISRLESKRLWPADRARTPREYLALVAAEDPRKVGLAELTGSFERTWYGGRPAGEAEYRQADTLAASLIGATTAGPAAANGGGER